LKTENVPIIYFLKELIAYGRSTRLNIPQNLQPDENYRPYQVLTTTVNPSTHSARAIQ
jgi:hypothetical protein